MSTPFTLADEELIVRLREGSEVAYTVIYNRYKGLLYQHAYKRLRNQEAADDIIQELFTTLWVKRDKIAINTSLTAYLYTAVRNRIIDYVSHLKVETKYINSLQNFIDEGTAITDYRVRLKLLEELIKKEIAALPPKMREIFELSRKEHLSHREISEKLDISEKTVKNQVNNALKILRIRLGLFIYLFLLFKLR
jgi:RNA polymerase sigma-70 factor (family 1)